LGKLNERLDWLSEVLPESHQILFYLSRVAPIELDLYSIISNETDRAAILTHLDNSYQRSPERQMKALLDYLRTTRRWKFKVVDVFRAEHLQESMDSEEGLDPSDTNRLPLNPEKIVHTLARLFKREMQFSKNEAESFTFTHILQCWNCNFLRKQPDFYSRP